MSERYRTEEFHGVDLAWRDRMPQEEFLSDVFRGIQQNELTRNRLFVQGNEFPPRYVAVLRESYPRTISTKEQFQAIFGRLVFFHRWKGSQKIRAEPSPQVWNELYYSGGEKELPQLRQVVYAPVVVCAKEGQASYLINRRGFDEDSGIYYFDSRGLDGIELREGTTHIRKMLSGLPFRHDVYKNNVVAWLLGGIVVGERFPSPMLAVSGNTQKVGKTSLVQALGVILDGEIPPPLPQNTSEFSKQLGERFDLQKRFILIDNVVSQRNRRTYKNSVLSSALTSGDSTSVRLLGHARRVNVNSALFALTANDARLEKDLTERALTVVLYAEDICPHNPYVLDYARDHREEIYGELLSLAMKNPSSIRVPQTPEYRRFRFVQWLQFVYPRIKSEFGELGLKESIQVDDVAVQLYEWGLAYGIDRPFMVEQFLDDLDPQAHDAIWQELGLTSRMNSEQQSIQIRAGIFLKRFLGESYDHAEAGRLVLVKKDTKQGAEYIFERDRYEND